LIIEVCSSAWYSKVVDWDVGSKAIYEQGACLKLEIFLPVNGASMRWPAGQPSRLTTGKPSSPPLRHSATRTAEKKKGGQALNLLTITLKTDSNKPKKREMGSAFNSC